MSLDPLTKEETDRFFPDEAPVPADGVFELGLVLGGTVSAGAYTAGVLDFIVEALDAWTRARDRSDARAPKHAVLLTGIAGTSGGGINGAIATRALRYAFAPVRKGSTVAERAANPFYDTWVEQIGIRHFLSLTDLEGGFRSLLNSSRLTDIAKAAVAFKGTVRDPERPWLPNPFRLFTMVGNLRGIPYRIPFEGDSGLAHDLVSHADFIRFALTGIGARTREPVRPDEFALDDAEGANWDKLADAALATSAFPIAFEARPLTRPMDHLRYRVVVTPDGPGAPARVRAICPTNASLGDPRPADPYSFFCVDGGTLNNEPIDVLRTFMAGMTAQSPRDGRKAKRALVLVDPFSDPETLDPTCDPSQLDGKPLPLLGEAGGLLNTWIYNSRFKPVDVALAMDPDIYSRFLIAPVGPWPGAGDPPDNVVSGTAAIASGGLGGFLGFFHPDFVRYDFLLGRRNAQQFLRRHLVLPADNPLFASWTQDQRGALGFEDKTGTLLLPVVPLLGDCAAEEQLEVWPAGRFVAAEIEDQVGARLSRVVDALDQEVAPKNPLLRVFFEGYLALGKNFAEKQLKKIVVEKIDQALGEKALK